jgi:hypothetical protein
MKPEVFITVPRAQIAEIVENRGFRFSQPDHCRVQCRHHGLRQRRQPLLTEADDHAAAGRGGRRTAAGEGLPVGVLGRADARAGAAGPLLQVFTPG